MSSTRKALVSLILSCTIGTVVLSAVSCRIRRVHFLQVVPFLRETSSVVNAWASLKLLCTTSSIVLAVAFRARHVHSLQLVPASRKTSLAHEHWCHLIFGLQLKSECHMPRSISMVNKLSLSPVVEHVSMLASEIVRAAQSISLVVEVIQSLVVDRVSILASENVHLPVTLLTSFKAASLPTSTIMSIWVLVFATMSTSSSLPPKTRAPDR